MANITNNIASGQSIKPYTVWPFNDESSNFHWENTPRTAEQYTVWPFNEDTSSPAWENTPLPPAPPPSPWNKLALTSLNFSIIPAQGVKKRFGNVECAAETVVSISNSSGAPALPIHANRVGQGITERKNIIASQFPYPEYWSAMYQERVSIAGGNYLIVDLTSKNEEPFYPEEEASFSDINVQLIERNGQFFTYKLHPQDSTQPFTTIQRLHFNEWPDHGIISVEDLHSLVLQIESFIPHPSDGLWVHCRAGLGRTGTLVAALIIKEQIENGKIASDNLESAVFNIIVTLRRQRNESFVHHQDQLTLLLNYAKSER